MSRQLHYPEALDGPLNEVVDDKIRQCADYKNRPSHAISFMSVVASTTGRLHCELVRLLFLQAHRDSDRLLAASAVQLA